MADQKNQYISPPWVAILWGLLIIFVLRVIGQMLVAASWNLGFLPPMEEWQSGLLPYPWLVVSQIAIIFLYGSICVNFSRGEGFWTTPRRNLGKGFLIFGTFYFASMIVRYVLRMWLHTEARWFGGTIPIFLHCILATFLLVVGNFHLRYSKR